MSSKAPKTAAEVAKQTGKPQVNRVAGEKAITVVTYPSTRVIAFGQAPVAVADFEPALHAKAALDELETLEGILHASHGAVMEGDRKLALENVKVFAENVENYMGAVARDEAALYQPPRAADAVEQIEDMEIRAHARSLTGDARTKLLRTVKDDPRLVLAFARDPLRTPVFSEIATHRWHEEVQRSKPEAVADIAVRKDGGVWARVIVGAVHDLVKSTPIQQ